MTKTPEVIGYTEAVTEIVNKFAKSRVTRFVKSHNLTPEQIHIHNEIPVNVLVKQFKTENSIKCRTYKNLSEDMKQKWLQFYDSHKQLKLMSNEEHNNFHKSNVYDSKTNTWNSNTSSEPQVKSQSGTVHKSTKLTKSKMSEEPKNQEVTEETKNELKEDTKTSDEKRVKPIHKSKSKTVHKPRPIATRPKK